MKKYWLGLYKAFIAILLVVAIIFLSITIYKKDELVTEKITLKYFEDIMNNYDEEKLKDFIANSENDDLYNNAVKTMGTNHTDTISSYEFTINNYELFGNGKYQCYFNLKNVPTCDVRHEGKYMNYLIDTREVIVYKDGAVSVFDRKALVVFVKDGSNGNLFEWKLVRYDKTKTIVQ